MTSSSGSDVTSRYPPSGCSLYVAARPGQRLSFTVFTLGGPGEAAGGGWAEQVPGGSACDARRSLYIDDDGRTASSSLCHLPRFQSRQRLAYTSTYWRVALYWTWTDHWTNPGTSLDSEDQFTSYILKVDGQLRFTALAITRNMNDQLVTLVASSGKRNVTV